MGYCVIYVYKLQCYIDLSVIVSLYSYINIIKKQKNLFLIQANFY